VLRSEDGFIVERSREVIDGRSVLIRPAPARRPRALAAAAVVTITTG
jgi:hypothetical protein